MPKSEGKIQAKVKKDPKTNSSYLVIREQLEGEDVVVNLEDLENDGAQYEIEEDKPYNLKERFIIASRAGLCEALIATSYCLAVTPFIRQTPRWYNNPFTTLTLLSLNFLTRLYNVEELPKKLTYSMYAIRGFFFSVIGHGTISSLIHELGHLSFRRMVSNSKENIYLQPSINHPEAWTHYEAGNFTAFGESIGQKNGEILFDAGGVTFEMLRNLASLILVNALSKKYPQVSTYILVRMLYDMTDLLLYAASPYSLNCSKNESNDFCALQKNDVPPYAMIALMVSSMLFLQLTISCLSHCCKKAYRNDETVNESASAHRPRV